MEKIIGREIEKLVLKSISESANAEFLAVYGRRRVGKTYLIKQFFENRFTFYLTGTANIGNQQQLINFFNTYNQHANNPLEKVPKTWFEAFEALKTHIIESESKHKVVFLDELPWLDAPKSNFVQALEYFWNSFGSTHDSLKLVVCGSAASWMLSEIINNRGGLHNRLTKRISLKPFNLLETEQYFRSKNVILERYHIVQLFAVMGGIPYYLNEVEQGQSVFQIIDKTCFNVAGLLRKEYQQLYNSLFKKAEKHEAIVEALSSKAKGLTRNEIAKLTKIGNGGTFSKVLEELEISGFIKKYAPFQRRTQNSLYQLTDPYSLFYHKFIKNLKSDSNSTWSNLLDSSTYRAWVGYAFEYVCLSHIYQIKKALGISGIYTEESSWIGKTDEIGVQIDLLIDRKDGIINLCEMKFTSDKYEITKDYSNQLRSKVNVFKKLTETKKTVFLTMVTSFGLKQNQYSLGLVQNSLTIEDLFVGQN